MESGGEQGGVHGDNDLRQERDFYRQLIALGEEDEVIPFVDAALALVSRMAGARRGYVELNDGRSDRLSPVFTRTHGCPSVDSDAFRLSISRSVIDEALGTEETVISAAAVDDARFRERGSVRRNQIQAVLCAPILAGSFSGVIYLQGRDGPGPFTDEDISRVELFARHVAALSERLLLRRHIERAGDPTQPYRRSIDAEEVVGTGPAMARVLRDISLAAPIDVSVLLTGPTGTGKTMLARVLHKNSQRAGRPFMEINCAALPAELIESELFGAYPGAHSTATRRIEGKVAAADGGTLFLDEIGELRLGAQAKLLQLLQDKAYFPLAATQALRADVRIIAATNRDLEAEVAARRFREDLYYRLKVLAIRVPGLNERAEDIPELLRQIVAKICDRYGFATLGFAPSALCAAETCEWPGSVRQLENAVEAAVIRAHGAGVAKIEVAHLFPGEHATPAAETFQGATRRFQRRLIAECLDQVGWNVSEAARQLDLSRQYLHKLITSFGLARAR